MKNLMKICLVVFMAVAFVTAGASLAIAKGGNGGGQGKGSEKSNAKDQSKGSEKSSKHEEKGNKDKNSEVTTTQTTHTSTSHQHPQTTTVTTTQTTTVAKGAMPPGWSKGKKTGWRGGSVPPGWQKKNTREQEEWVRYRDEEGYRVQSWLSYYKFTDIQQMQILSAYDQRLADGLAVATAADRLVNAINDSTSRKNLMIDSGKAALELLR